mgnify:CR=1 FL=1
MKKTTSLSLRRKPVVRAIALSAFLLGTLGYRTELGRWLVEFWEGDQLTPDLLQLALRRVGERFFAPVGLKANSAQQEAVAAQAGVASYSGPVASGGSDGFGFFQAPGTNYSVGDEPTLAAKLNELGKALHLHLIGLSGYRTPQHSIEVGGFPNDPHTKGQASDTPGVEGVDEATLNRFGLTRPFAGAAEADHIQLVGSI